MTTATTPPRTGSIAAPPREDPRKRILRRLLEKFDPAKARNKPLSMQRPEVRRQAEQLADQEGVPAVEREAVVDDVLAEVPGIGPLEELFRDESVTEFLMMGHNQVIRRSGDGWLPVNVQFKDRKQYRLGLKKFFAEAEQIGEKVRTGDGGFDGKLPNGFRLIAIVPPSALEQPPLALFRREKAKPAVPADPPPASESLSKLVSRRTGEPWERTRQRVTGLLIQRLASKGVYDLRALPEGELPRIVALYVQEFNDLEKLHLDSAAQHRLTNEIIANMHR